MKVQPSVFIHKSAPFTYKVNVCLFSLKKEQAELPLSHFISVCTAFLPSLAHF